MRQVLRLLAVLAASILVGCATTKFSAFEGDGKIHEGSGGTREIVDGMEIWDHGNPPSRFRILGVIEDERPDGPISLSQLSQDVVKQARAIGGDALIRESNRSQLRGFVTSGTSNIPVRRNYATFAVIKYVNDVTSLTPPSDSGSPANATAQADKNVEALFEAATAGREKRVRTLLDEGCDVNARDDRGRTILHIAAMRGHNELVDMLIARGATVDVQDLNGDTPFSLATAANSNGTMRALIRGGASPDIARRAPRTLSRGTGFFITRNGHIMTNEHVVAGARVIRVYSRCGEFEASLVRTDPANDLALLKVNGTCKALPVKASTSVRLGTSVVTVGFPNTSIQGQAPKYARGEIAALSGTDDDPRYFQISVPLQPGNSGGPLVDPTGAVVGVVAAGLNQLMALRRTGHIPENVNYAIKGSFVLALLESVTGITEQFEPVSDAVLEPADLAGRVEAAVVRIVTER